MSVSSIGILKLYLHFHSTLNLEEFIFLKEDYLLMVSGMLVNVKQQLWRRKGREGNGSDW